MTVNIGLDIGGTKIEIIALDSESQNELYRQRINTPNNYPAFLNSVVDLIRSAEAELKTEATVGICIPGIVNPDKTINHAPANLPFLSTSFAKDVEQALGREIRLENDARCFALSEAVDGAAKDARVAYCIIIGTGVGGCLVVDGKIIKGANNLAGEWGHIPLPFATPEELDTPCGCGRIGCIETHISGKHVLKNYNRMVETPVRSVGEINRLATNGDGVAVQIMNEFYCHLARALLDIIVIVDPDVIVVGGGCSRIDAIYKTVPQLIERFWERGKMNLNIKKAMHGDSSGVRGAAWLWRQ